jgi:hypothetical protein
MMLLPKNIVRKLRGKNHYSDFAITFPETLHYPNSCNGCVCIAAIALILGVAGFLSGFAAHGYLEKHEGFG